jgi:hypothetical protein
VSTTIGFANTASSASADEEVEVHLDGPQAAPEVHQHRAHEHRRHAEDERDVARVREGPHRQPRAHAAEGRQHHRRAAGPVPLKNATGSEHGHVRAEERQRDAVHALRGTPARSA